MVWHGKLDAGILAEMALSRFPDGSDGARASLPGLIELLAQYTPSLREEEIPRSNLAGFAQVLTDIAAVTEAVGNPAMAYNFYEVIVHILEIGDFPALAVAEKLDSLSNPDMINQLHGAKWRLATERLRYAIDNNAHWLAAFDAIELALTCLVPHHELRQGLFERLQARLLHAENNPLGELAYALLFEARPGTISV